MPNESWVEQQENNMLFTGGTPEGPELKMLEYGETNRIVTVKEARLLAAWTLLADATATRGPAWDWMHAYARTIEKLQLTIGKPTNDRDQYLAALKAQLPPTMTDPKEEKKRIL